MCNEPRKLHRPVSSLVLLGLLGWAIGCATDDPGQELAVKQEPQLTPRFSRGRFSKSGSCKSCHVDIHRHWSVSAHATSFRNRNFQVAHRQYEARAEDGKPSPCLVCHAPLTLHASTQEKYPEWTPASTLADEGVGCDFCHSVTGVYLDQPQSPYSVKPGRTKRGPVKGASEKGHGVAYSELFQESLFCAGCHEYRSPQGLPIISTYSEWKEAASHNGNKSCQQCHMPVEPGAVVDAKVLRTSTPVNVHRMPGSHSRGQLREALLLRIEKLEQVGEQVRAEVSVENRGGGHHVPTGMPTRKLILEVEAATPEGRQFRGRRVFQRQLVDSKGLSISSDSAAFLDAVAVAEDNRIRSGERRLEVFEFPIPHDQSVSVRAGLAYSYSPQPENLPEERLAIMSAERNLRAR